MEMMENKMDITGPQLIHEACTGTHIAHDQEGRCAMCGGKLSSSGNAPITKNYFSDNWTDSPMLSCKESEFLCPACDWMIKGSGRRKVWGGCYNVYQQDGMWASSDAQEFLDFLSNMAFPAVFMLHDPLEGKGASQKYVPWNSFHAVSYSRNICHFVCFKLHVGREVVSDVITLSLDQLIDDTQRMMELAKKYVEPLFAYEEKKRKPYYYASRIKDHTMEALGDGSTPQLMLVAFLAGHALHPAETT